MKNKLKKLSSGFTVVEVIIVLAVAGLIMAIVFLAVPQAQRNSRNTQRRADVTALLTTVRQYKDEHTGDLPKYIGLFSDSGAFGQLSPSLSFFTDPDDVVWFYGGSRDEADAKLRDFIPELEKGNKVLFLNYSECLTPNSGRILPDPPEGPPPAIALTRVTGWFYVEAGGDPTAQCVDLKATGV